VSNLIYDCLVISETRTNSKPKKIQTKETENQQYHSHTDVQSALEFYIIITSMWL